MMMAKCGNCGKETSKQEEAYTAVALDPVTKEERTETYTMPVLCADCEKDGAAMSSELGELTQIAQDWRTYRTEGDETPPRSRRTSSH